MIDGAELDPVTNNADLRGGPNYENTSEWSPWRAAASGLILHYYIMYAGWRMDNGCIPSTAV